MKELSKEPDSPIKEKGLRSWYCTLVLDHNGNPIKCFRKHLKAEYYIGNSEKLSLLRIKIE